MSDCNSSDESKPRILLYPLRQVGLIILYPTGIIFQNQTGGISCIQRSEEGIFFPVSDAPVLDENYTTKMDLLDIELTKLFPSYATNLKPELADKIDLLLRNYLPLKGVTVDRNRLNDSDEAWIYVNIEPSELADYSGFGSSRGVLTWSNSD
jgi:hypothetical protein